MQNSQKDVYMLLRDSYEGMGGFLDGSYLVQHPREAKEKYSLRCKLAYYLNYFKPCVNAHVSPVFKTNAYRDWKGMGSSVWEMFYNDTDFRGTNLKDLMKQAALQAKINGTAFIVMDRVEDAGDVTSLAALENKRDSLPYAFVVDPVRVDEVVLDKYGRIIKFVYKEKDMFVDNRMATRTLTPDGWELSDSQGLSKGQWNLGVVPVVAVPSKLDRDAFNPFPPSEFVSIAKANLAIYNMSSWLNDILTNQTFSILVYPNDSTDDLILGTSNALGFPTDSNHEPKFISPAADPANILHNEINRLQEECYRMAGVVNVTGVKSENSGVAKAWDFEQTNQTLSDFADIIEAAEMKIAKLYARFTGVEFEYTVNYPDDYSISDIATELNNAVIAKDLNFGDEFNVQVFKRVLTSYLPEVKDDEFDTLVEAYKASVEQQKLDEEQTPLPKEDDEE